MNKIVLLGKLIKDPELKTIENGEKSFTRFIIAVDRNFKSADGTRKADLIPVTIWGRKAENDPEGVLWPRMCVWWEAAWDSPFEKEKNIYRPRSVVNCKRFEKIENYWKQTKTVEALQFYINMNLDWLKDDVLSMSAGEKVPVNTGSFTNDMTTFRTEDDVLTLLIHLGYLGYDSNEKCVFIPNNEIRSEYVNAVSVSDWGEVSQALKNSADILNAIWQRRPEQVAEGIRQAHFETSHIQYNDENALSYTISLALYAARNFYTVHRELAGGKGFADMVYIPRKKYPEKPALVVELKWDKSAAGAISQIKGKEYCQSLEEYQGNLLLVGINYDVKTKEHSCVIEEFVK